MWLQGGHQGRSVWLGVVKPIPGFFVSSVGHLDILSDLWYTNNISGKILAGGFGMFPELKLVDKVTGGVVGFVYREDIYSVAVSKGKAEALSLPEVDVLGYMELPVCEVVSCRGKYAVIGNELGYLQELSMMPYEFLGENRVALYGYVFTENCLVSLDDDIAINRLMAKQCQDEVFGW